MPGGRISQISMERLGDMIRWLSARRRRPKAETLTGLAAGHEDAVLQNMALLMGAIDVPAFMLDSNDRILCHSTRALDFFPNIADGQPLLQVTRNPGLIETVRLARHENITRSGELADRTAFGPRMTATVTPLRLVLHKPGANNERAGVLLVQFRDLSEQDRLSQLRSDFIANASHELRTPLASLKGFIETLQGPASGDAAARTRFLGIMEAQAARMARILDDLLSLSRIEMRAHLAPRDKVDVAAIALAAVHGLEPIATEAGIELALAGTSQPVYVRGDRDELEQVFQNLIENAIKYGRHGGHVQITIQQREPSTSSPDRIAIEIADDGPGIAETHLPRLTERFYRVDTATSRERGGTGLGLAIVKHILNRHRGELEITSTVGRGSKFTVVLRELAPRAT